MVSDPVTKFQKAEHRASGRVENAQTDTGHFSQLTRSTWSGKDGDEWSLPSYFWFLFLGRQTGCNW